VNTRPLAAAGSQPSASLTLTLRALQLYRTNSTATGWACRSRRPPAPERRNTSYVTRGQRLDDGLTWATASSPARRPFGIGRYARCGNRPRWVRTASRPPAHDRANGFIWAPESSNRPSAQATAGSNRTLDSASRVVWTGAQAADDFYTLKCLKTARRSAPVLLS